MKKIISLFMAVVIAFSISIMTFAQEPTELEVLENIYETAYNRGISVVENSIEDDYSAYAFILNNDVVVIENNKIILSNVQLPQKELMLLQDFISRLNILLDKSAIEIDRALRISIKEVPTIENRLIPKAMIIDLMPETRSHANELKVVFDNAIFGTAHIVAGVYFTERVKSGGIWDYKVYLGTNNSYYESELQALMTGETIGNFHYGFVGSAVFGATTLKTAGGLVQIVSGTSDFSFWDSYFDDPRDTQDIQWGISRYNLEY